MAKVTILSTLSNNFTFVDYIQPDDPKLLPYPRRRIRIFGGANRASMNGIGDMTTDNAGVPIWTRSGVTSTVEEEDLKWLKENASFKAFVEVGHLKILDTDRQLDHARVKSIVAADMTARDGHAPMVKGDPRSRQIKIVVPGSEDGYDGNRI
jgi:hypothetical protein